MIYFMQAVGGGPIKIGVTDNLKTRHAGLESLYGTRLVILATMEGDQGREQEIHEQFAHLRLGRTEQFRPEADLMGFIGLSPSCEVDPKDVEAMPVRTLPSSLSLRGTREWRDWLNRYAKNKGMTVSKAVDEALLSFAVERGFELPPCRTKDEE